LGTANELRNDQVSELSISESDQAFLSMAWVESHPVTMIRIDSLVLDHSPRLAGADTEHIRLLAESGAHLPPIVVHRPTMAVIDGVHRVQAALRNGRTEIAAWLLDCDDNVAFVLGVRANITHGLPLSQADRAAAAERILANQPHWSDRAVAAVAGLSDKTVSRIRARSTAPAPQSNTRLGRDGRMRPLDAEHRRQQAAAMILDRPNAGLREVAKAIGLSAATVRDVRKRIERGEDPVPERLRLLRKPDDAAVTPLSRTRRGPGDGRSRERNLPADRDVILARLRDDPSIRFSDAGRNVLRWLHQHNVNTEDLENLGNGLPDHWAPVVAGLARSCANEWIRFAEHLEQRNP
jgi:ParB-like chromosome segregation protein Spo0J